MLNNAGCQDCNDLDACAINIFLQINYRDQTQCMGVASVCKKEKQNLLTCRICQLTLGQNQVISMLCKIQLIHQCMSYYSLIFNVRFQSCILRVCGGGEGRESGG